MSHFGESEAELAYYDRRVKPLERYFTNGLERCEGLVGMEIETLFVGSDGQPISLAQSQDILVGLAQRGWDVVDRKNTMITELRSTRGDKVLYEVGWCNIEVSAAPTRYDRLVPNAMSVLGQLYSCAERVGARPLEANVLETQGQNLLVIPDERDSIWLKIDGLNAFNLLATIAAVHICIDIPLSKAVGTLTRLAAAVPKFLKDFKENNDVWERYIELSNAGYAEDRYGCPWGSSRALYSLGDYCRELARHNVVTSDGLRAREDVAAFEIDRFLRSVWWFFRLRRYGDQLCIEVRPLPRRADADFQKQLEFVLDTIGL